MEISVGLKFKMERLLKEIENCILVCANCHRDIHAQDKTNNFIEKLVPNTY